MFLILRNLIFLFIMNSMLSAYAAEATTQPTQALIYIIGTGGTIAGSATSATSSSYQSGKLSEAQLTTAIPAIKKLAQIKTLDLFQIDSADITLTDWIKLAKTVDLLIKKPDVKGIVITHGTDTMEETAYFLDLVIKTVKPIVLVGSMRPATSISADGPLNLYNAIAVAASPNSIGKGVLVVMNDQIYDARDVTKTNTTRVDTFRSRNTGPLGLVDFGKVRYYKTAIDVTHATPFTVSDLNNLPKVEIIYEYAGTDGQLFQYAINSGVSGIVFAGSGDGNIAAPERQLLKSARDKGIIIVRSSRTGSGKVTYNYVHNLDSLLGLIPADDLNPQKARVLLLLALTKTHDPKQISQFFALF